MKKHVIVRLLTLTGILFLCIQALAQQADNWTAKQLMAPKDLANSITFKDNIPVIISVGPGAAIPNSVEVGMTGKKEGVDKLKAELSKIQKNTKLVIYCGCCPFEHCPNVRPAIKVLKEMKFTNYFLLDLPHNLKTDWIDKHYPVSNR